MERIEYFNGLNKEIYIEDCQKPYKLSIMVKNEIEISFLNGKCQRLYNDLISKLDKNIVSYDENSIFVHDGNRTFNSVMDVIMNYQAGDSVIISVVDNKIHSLTFSFNVPKFIKKNLKKLGFRYCSTKDKFFCEKCDDPVAVINLRRYLNSLNIISYVEKCLKDKSELLYFNSYQNPIICKNDDDCSCIVSA